jgi:DNA-binding transcriptional LysR family regulator
MNTPELRQLRHFVAVAEHLHFGRAAQALHISQPPLSRSIQDMERRLGALLFARTRRKVELTPEGTRFLAEAKRLLAQLERALVEVGSMAAGAGGRLRLGFVSLADFGVLPGLLKAYKAARPGVTLALREMLSPEQAAALAAGELDFGLLLPPVAGDLEHLVVQRERFVAALPARHRLARGAGRLAVRELADEAFVMAPREIAPGLHDVVALLAARRAGSNPDADRGKPGLERSGRRAGAGLGRQSRAARRRLSGDCGCPSAARPVARLASRQPQRRRPRARGPRAAGGALA